MSKEDRITPFPLDDGAGIIGWGFRCPTCGRENEDVDEDEPLLHCIFCGKALLNNRVEPI